MKGGGIKFGTDGWRGVIGEDFTLANVELVAGAAAAFALSDRRYLHNKKILVSFDRRFLSEQAAGRAAAVFCAAGLETDLCCSPFPSSAVSLLTAENYGLGVQVTASHNPYYYNGVKFKWKGGSAPAGLMAGLEQRLGARLPRRARPAAPAPVSHDGQYLEYLRSRVSLRRVAARLRAPVALDFMHGCAAGYLEKLFRPGTFQALRSGRDAFFGMSAPEPVEAGLKGLAAGVRAAKAACGFAFDGDGDRFAVFDEKGRYLSPPVVFGLVCDYVINFRGGRGPVVQSVSMGRLSASIAARAGLPVEETYVGFKALAERLRAGDAVAAAEESGGYTWKGNLPERDGLVTALLFMEMLAETRLSLSALTRRLAKEHGPSHYLRRDLALLTAAPDKAETSRRLRARLPARPLGLRVVRVSELDGVKLTFEDGGWLLIRPSGTEPLVRIYSETPSAQATAALVELAVRAVRKEGLA